jgi:hypothetical protein
VTAHQKLSREIAIALKTIRVNVKNLYGWRPKLEEALMDVSEGRVSHSTGQPLIVSRLDTPRGGVMILDGYHRAIEAIQAGQPRLEATVSEFLPRIERAGGAYRAYVENKANVLDRIRRR